MVTGDSQEEVMIFRYKQTNRHFIIIYISSSSSSGASGIARGTSNKTGTEIEAIEEDSQGTEVFHFKHMMNMT